MTIGFLHTAEAHVAPFSDLLEEVAPGCRSTHVVDETLLAIARVVEGLEPGYDVIVLAQASMAGAVARCRTATPVLSSPRPAVDAAVSFV